MDELDGILDEEKSHQPKEVPEVVKTLAIFSIIGNSLWLFILLIITFYIMVLGTVFDSVLPGPVEGLMAIVAVVMLLIMGLHIAGIIAAVKMRKGKKGGFILYAIATGLWVLMLIIAALNPGAENVYFNWGCAAISIGFIVAFGLQMKNMPNNH